LTEPWNARVKDRLENRLHHLVVVGQVDLKTAQRDIAEDWIAAYKKYVGPEPRAAAVADKSASRVPTEADLLAAGVCILKFPPSESQVPRVWVNLKSGVYWRPGTVYYGKTKQGEYMSEPDALAHGYRSPGGKP
jgi:hypothetical protein